MGIRGDQLSLTLFSFHLLRLLLLFCGTSRAQTGNPVTDIACKLVNCGQGTCKEPANGGLFPPFDCECMPGWKKVEIGNVTLPPCILPNCTLDFDCGNVYPPSPPAPPPPPPPAQLFPLLNISDPCSYTFCGDGSCVRTEEESGGYICKCNEGSDNLLGITGLLCMKKCSINADCDNVSLGPFGTPPPPNLSEAPYLGKDGGHKDDGNFARNQPVLTTLLLVATFIPWI